MKRLVFAMAMVLGGLAACVDSGDQIGSGSYAVEGDETTAPTESTDVVNDNPGDHLPGGCNGFACSGQTGGTGGTGGGGSGTNPTMCSGCACTASPTTCQSCLTRCGLEQTRCYGNADQATCDELYKDCHRNCGGENLTCVCPSHP
jgi:hypothetical protein